ncbi:MAG: hypothetical protein M3168_02150, partial [Actinomycetota bacterium]|nr:hypothetical protein [Actinomycetota bacterium]
MPRKIFKLAFAVIFGALRTQTIAAASKVRGFRERASMTLGAVAVLLTMAAGAAVARGEDGPPAVHALFGLSQPSDGPFPANWFTVDDPSKLTGIRVSLPLPECSARPSDCDDIGVLNSLDGFNLQPRVSIPFDGEIDLTTATGENL